MNFDKKDVLTLISLGVTIILGIFSKDVENPIVLIVVICVAVVVILGVMFFWKNREVRQLSNAGVIAKSRKYTNYMLKLVKANSKRLNREKNTTDWKKIQLDNKKIISLVKKDCYLKQNESHLQQLRELEKKRNESIKKAYSDNKYYIPEKGLDANSRLTAIAELADLSQAQKTSKIICDTIMSMQRIFLELEQYKLRVKFGEYLIRHSTNVDQIIAGYVDFLGWTYILEGNVKKGKECVRQGIQFIDSKIADCKGIKIDGYPDDFEEYRYKLLKARALRHIGTTYYTYKGKNYDEINGSMEEALKMLQSPEATEYYLKTIPQFRDSTTDETVKKALNKMIGDYDKMVFGLEYNKILLDFYRLQKNSTKTKKDLDIIEEKVNDLYDSIKGRDVDEHRKVKFLTLKNQVSRNQMILGDEESQIAAKKSYNNFKRDLAFIEKILNGNIYFDEAMEVYVYQKVQGLYHDVNTIMTSSIKKSS